MGTLRFHPSAVGAVAAAGAGTAIGLWLVFAAHFAIGTSPGWLFGPYYLMLALILLATGLAGCHPVFCWVGWPHRLLPVMVFVFLGFFLTESWVISGPFEDFRDGRHYTAVLRSSALALLVLALLGLVKAFLLTLALLRYRTGWRCLSDFPLLSRVTPAWESVDDLGERRPGEDGPRGQDNS